MFCSKCGKEIPKEAVICTGCGCLTENTTLKKVTDPLLVQLSEKIKTNAIIWLVIGCIQIISGMFFIVGILNIVSAINDMNYSKTIFDDPSNIVQKFESLTMPIITLVYNLIFGGIIGIAGSIYYFISIRGFVLENRTEFEKLSV